MALCRSFSYLDCLHRQRPAKFKAFKPATLCVNAWVYLCVPIKSSFVIDLFRVDMTLTTLKKKRGKDGGCSVSICVFVTHKGRGRE